ncbi:MAG TPA: PDZ domain-containing protein [Polyangiales bacterium]
MTSPAPDSAEPQTAPDNLWSIRFVDAQLPEFKGGGLQWDSDGTPPDPFVRLVINGRKIWESPVQRDTRHPVWNTTLPRNIYVPPGANFRIELWDDDAATNDPAGVLLRSGLPETARPDALAHLGLDNLATVTVIVSAPRASRGLGVAFEEHSDALVLLSVEPFSPAARAGLKTGERIVAIGDSRVSQLTAAKAASELSLSSDHGSTLVVADEHGKEREVPLDRDFLWLLM